MTENGREVGKSVAPISTWSPSEMKVTEDRSGHHRKEKKHNKRQSVRKNVDITGRELNGAMPTPNRRITFSVVNEGGRRVVNMTDADTHILIRQIGVEDLSRVCMSDVLGVLIDKNG